MTTERQEHSFPRPKDTALKRAVKLLSTRPYSERKLREKLTGRQYAPEDIKEALDRLKRDRLLNDRNFAEEFVRARLKARPRAASRMVTDLLARGIPLTLAREVVTELMPKNDEISLAKEFVLRKQAQYADLDDETRWRRLAGLLARRGFSYDTIRTVLGKSLNEVGD